MPTFIQIIVWRGFPTEDYKTTRHTALFFREDGADSGDAVHVSGTSQNYMLQRMVGYKPATSDRLAGSVQIAVTPLTLEEIRTIAEQVPVNNEDNGWNCQNWVGDALNHLVGRGLITAEECSQGLNGMVDILLEAADDQP